MTGHVPPEELTPLERATQAEGMAMLDKLQKLKAEAGASPLVGEDGKPLETEKSVKPPGETDQEEAEMLKRKREIQKRIEENAARLSQIMETNPRAAKCATTIHAAWQTLYWGMNELLTIEELDNELVQQMSDHLRAAAMSKGFDVGVLISKLRNTCVPFMMDRAAFYMQEQKKRKAKIKQIEKRVGKKGIALPCQSLRALFEEKPFNIGNMFVLHGKPDAVRAALKLCARHHMKENFGHPYYLSTEEKPQQPKNPTVMAAKWWVGKAENIRALEEVLHPIVEKEHSVLLLVEDADKLWEKDERGRDKTHLKVKATARLYQWAFENQVAVILGDVSDPFNEKIYGDLPRCAVALAELDEKPHVVIGSDTVPIEEDQ